MTKNLTKVLTEFLPLTQIPPIIQNKTYVLNLKLLKIQVLIGYLTGDHIRCRIQT
jgi:hypothetical protein